MAKKKATRKTQRRARGGAHELGHVEASFSAPPLGDEDIVQVRPGEIRIAVHGLSSAINITLGEGPQ